MELIRVLFVVMLWKGYVARMTASVSSGFQPNYRGCANKIALALPYCDESLSVDDRVNDLVSRLSLEEKVATISPQPSLGDTCGDHTAGKADIGLPDYFWLTETNTNVAALCYTDPYKCPTTFVGPLGMGSSFNRTSWKMKGSVLGTELRAFHNIGWHRANTGNKIGLTGFGPNLNIARDPRFGRVSELPGEDPFHSGIYGYEMVSGMQEPDARGHPKMLAYLKHFTAYSRETNRGHDTYNITTFDFFDTYLKQYEIAFKANASGVMCSYDAENGNPSCANDFILNEVLRKRFNQPHALVTTDCGAVNNMLGAPVYAPTELHAAAWTIGNGTDIEMGSTIWTNNLTNAVRAGMVTEDVVTRSVTRAFRQLFLAGRFDRPENVGWATLGVADINSTWAQQVQREAGLQSMVLLKNKDELLPLKRGSQIAVVGPMSRSRDLMSDYAGGTGESGCWPNSDESCVTTIADAIARANTGGHTTQAEGCDVNSNDTSKFADAIALVREADVAVLVLGNDRTIEHEGLDRPDIVLSGVQDAFAKAVLAVGKPTLLIMANGGALAIDDLVEHCDAIVEAFNPAQNTPELAAQLFGDENRWGKLPVTIYPASFAKEKAMTDYDMSGGVGRTYRYYTGTPLFAFGHGLSLTSFDLACERKTEEEVWPITVSCLVNNTGRMDGDEVIQVYHEVGQDIHEFVGNTHVSL